MGELKTASFDWFKLYSGASGSARLAYARDAEAAIISAREEGAKAEREAIYWEVASRSHVAYDRNEDCPILADSFIRQVKEWVIDDDYTNPRCLQFHDAVKGAPKAFPWTTGRRGSYSRRHYEAVPGR